MKWLARSGLSVLVIATCALISLPTAYAFGVSDALRTGLQYVQLALALVCVACIFTARGRGAAAALAGVALITAGILIANR